MKRNLILYITKINLEIFKMDIIYALGYLMLVLIATFVLFSFVGVLFVFIFRKKNKLFVSRTLLVFFRSFQIPIKYFMSFLGLESVSLDIMLVEMENKLYKKAFLGVPHEKRAVFLPHCLRHPQCPAKLSPEGIQCVNCGKCGIGEIKKEVEKRRIHVFIVPGSSFIKRMIRKYKPDAVVGVGCPMEVKEGMEMMAQIELPAQAVVLLRDGCMNTRVNVEELMQTIVQPEEFDLTRAEEISAKWEGN